MLPLYDIKRSHEINTVLRIYHSKNKNHQRIRMKPTCIKLSNLTKLCLVACLLSNNQAHADSNVITNVHGDEIIIYTEDTFKPAIRNVGGASNSADSASKMTDRKTLNAVPGTSATYNIGINPTYSNTEVVMPKTMRDDRLSKSLDISQPAEERHEAAAPQVERNDLWQRIKNGYAMPDSTSPLVKNHENWYSSRPDYVKRMVERSQRYLFHVVEEVEKRGMPTEIALLPMIESAYNPKAYSTSRASGIWQFVPSTGKYFGLKQNWWFDNRRNITFATDAALTYLEKLHAMFGAWDLALAAYNAGEGTVSRAIERNRRLGLPTDYENLNLPPETRNYVPKLQAVKNLMTNPGNYGLNIQTIANTPYFAKVTAPAQIDAHLAAKLAEISDEEFLALNPSFNRPVITSEDKNLELLLPILSAQTFRVNLENYNRPLVSWKTYFAKRGEKLEKIANKFGIHVSKLRDVNDLPAQNKIKKSATILVPNGNTTSFKPSSPQIAKINNTDANATASSLTNSNEVIASGVTLAEMEAEYASDPDYQANDPKEISQQDYAVNLESFEENEPKVNRSVRHRVKKGEVMATIAKRYGIGVKDIMAANALKTSRVKVGQVLRIDTIKTAAIKESHSKNKKMQTYVVKRGDTLHSIAQKFDVAVADLKRWNKIHNSRIQPGNKLTIKQSDEV